MTSRTRGISFSIAGAILLSPDVLVMRWLEMEHGEIVFWRGLFLTIGFSGIVLVRYRMKFMRAVIKTGWSGLGCGVFFATSTYCYTQAIQNTSAAASMMIISTAPAFAAIISWLVLCERSSKQTVLAIFLTLLGISIIAFDTGGHNSMMGNIFAIGCAICMAINFNLARFKAEIDITPGFIVGGVLLVAFSPMDALTQIQASSMELMAIALTAAISLPIGFTLLQIAPRYISATDVSLFLLLEAILGPFLVWLVLNEHPGFTTLLGSAVVMGALTFYAFCSRPKLVL